MRNALLMTLIAAALLAGCAGPGDEGLTESTQPRDTDIPGGGEQPSCVDEVGAPGGFGETGTTQPGRVGTGTGDIGSSVSCGTPNEAGDAEAAPDATE